MDFNIDLVLQNMVRAVTDTAQESSGDIKSQVETILEQRKATLGELAEARLDGEIDDTVFERELARERIVIETQLLTIKIMVKALAEKAINAAMDVFVSAVKAAI